MPMLLRIRQRAVHGRVRFLPLRRLLVRIHRVRIHRIDRVERMERLCLGGMCGVALGRGRPDPLLHRELGFCGVAWNSVRYVSRLAEYSGGERSREIERGKYARKLGNPPPVFVLREEALRVVLSALLAQSAELALAFLNSRLGLRRALHVLRDDRRRELGP